MKLDNTARPFGARFLEVSYSVRPPEGDMAFTTSSTFGGGCEGLECDLNDEPGSSSLI